MVEDNNFLKHQAICDLLDIDLTCPHCNEILIIANERREKQNTIDSARAGMEESDGK